MNEYEDILTDKQYEGHLIDEYYFLSDLLSIATDEKAVMTIKIIKRKMDCIKFKLLPLKIPESL